MSKKTRSPGRWLLCLALAFGAGLPFRASAQASGVAAGDRVRVTLPCPEATQALPIRDAGCGAEGTVARFTPDTIELVVGSSLETHPLSSIGRLEVRRVEGPGWTIPAALGLLLGGAGTYALLHGRGSTSLCDRSRNQDAMSRGECAGLTLVGGAVGAGLGALTAVLLRTERWVTVPLGHVRLFDRSVARAAFAPSRRRGQRHPTGARLPDTRYLEETASWDCVPKEATVHPPGCGGAGGGLR